MASISKEPDGRKVIQFVGKDGKRRSIRLGKCDKNTAAAVKVKVERLVTASITDHAWDNETAEWVKGLDQNPKMRDKLVRAGLLPPIEPAPDEKQNEAAVTLGDFLEQYVSKRSDVKPGSKLCYKQTQDALVSYFGADRPLASITAADAEDWPRAMLADKYAVATVSRRTKYARQFFKYAVKGKIISENPFEDVKPGPQDNSSRMHDVTRDEIAKVIDACPCHEWRLLFALARFGGLRIPSEALALRWTDIDWAAGTIRVTCVKTERHKGKGSRIIPLFPELRPYLEQTFELAEPGTEYVITRYRDSSVNLRTQAHRIIRKAGLTPWEKVFQNCRSTRETELSERFPIGTVVKWMGNSVRVAAKHYLQARDEHFQRALRPESEALQNPVQYASGSNRSEREASRESVCIPAENDALRYPTNRAVGPAGFEPATKGL